MDTNRKTLLQPYRVLDLTDDYGLLCGKILGDMGADVIKVEKPGGAKAREKEPFVGGNPDPEKSLYWFGYNTSKRGITLNLECDEGKEIFLKLAANADFIVESFQPGYLDKLGLGYGELAKRNPRVIVTSITPFGQTGPNRDLKSTDLTIMSMSGLVWMCGDADRAPVCHNLEQVDTQAGAQAAVASLIAHHQRQISGRGVPIDISIQECFVLLSGHLHHWWYYENNIQSRHGAKTERGHLCPQVIFPCADGFISWRVFVGPQGAKTRALVKWMEAEGKAGRLADVDWAKIDMNVVTQSQLESWEKDFADVFMQYPKKRLKEEAAMGGIMLFPVNTVAEIIDDAQLKSRNFWEKVEHPELGASYTYPGAPFKVDGPKWRISRRAPLIGEHNDEIYCGELGLSPSYLDELRSRSVI